MFYLPHSSAFPGATVLYWLLRHLALSVHEIRSFLFPYFDIFIYIWLVQGGYLKVRGLSEVTALARPWEPPSCGNSFPALLPQSLLFSQCWCPSLNAFFLLNQQQSPQ